jgi:hypothetical protein
MIWVGKDVTQTGDNNDKLWGSSNVNHPIPVTHDSPWVEIYIINQFFSMKRNLLSTLILRSNPFPLLQGISKTQDLKMPGQLF